MQRAQIKLALLALLATASPDPTMALEPLCTGDSFLDNTGPMNNHFPLVMDDSTHLVHVWTWSGDAAGILSVTEAVYSGLVVDKAGNQHSVTLDRHTGELLIMPFPLSSEGGKAEFMGRCVTAKKLF